jgi:hypothetical protein
MKKKPNPAMHIIQTMNPFYKNKDTKYLREHFYLYQKNGILPILVQPIQSALNHGNKRIAQMRFNQLFNNLGLKYDYDALMLRAYLHI